MVCRRFAVDPKGTRWKVIAVNESNLLPYPELGVVLIGPSTLPPFRDVMSSRHLKKELAHSNEGERAEEGQEVKTPLVAGLLETTRFGNWYAVPILRGGVPEMQPGPMPTAGKRRMPRPALISAFRSLRKASKVFALFSAYMDESHDNNRVMCIGGWLAPDRLWEKIEDRWGKRVEHERRISIKKGFPPPSRFHAANCSSLKKEFDRAKGWDVGRQIRFAKVLIGIIGKEHLVGYVVGSSLQGYDAHYRSLKAAQRDVYGICMYHCLLLIGQDMELSWPSERVTIFHDHVRALAEGADASEQALSRR